MLLHSIAYEVLIRMRDLHPELNIDVEALEHIKLGSLESLAIICLVTVHIPAGTQDVLVLNMKTAMALTES